MHLMESLVPDGFAPFEDPAEKTRVPVLHRKPKNWEVLQDAHFTRPQ